MQRLIETQIFIMDVRVREEKFEERGFENLGEGGEKKKL